MLESFGYNKECLLTTIIIPYRYSTELEYKKRIKTISLERPKRSNNP
jgi:hypothetical protein